MVKYLLTIIVPIYKIEELFLRRCIESLISQSENGYKIILVDDGSPAIVELYVMNMHRRLLLLLLYTKRIKVFQ